MKDEKASDISDDRYDQERYGGMLWKSENEDTKSGSSGRRRYPL